MTDTRSSPDHFRLLESHLQSWGLKQFQDEAAYYRWQRSVLSQADLSSLNQLAQHRQNSENPSSDIRFYDLAATPAILPVLYSQRYDFFCAVAMAIASRISGVQRVLDFGCGVGILTTFWATIFPEVEFWGIDRSSQSIAVASEQASQRQLNNIHFRHCQIPSDDIGGNYDCVISTQALFQSEDHPGLCSVNWNTFDRSQDEALHKMVEDRTGVGERLDALCRVLAVNGKMLICEKARHLGRKVFLQRVFLRRDFQNIHEPLPLSYESFGEHIEDGPLYELSRKGAAHSIPWDEQPEWCAGQSIYPCSGAVANQMAVALGIHEAVTSDMVQQNHGTYTVGFGSWCKAITYGLVSTSTGFLGILLGSERDSLIIRQYLERFEKMSKSELRDSISQIWGMPQLPETHEPIPGYENHTIAAQLLWEVLPDREIHEEKTFREPDGRAMHIELGLTGRLTYVYWANTLDQRQLVMADTINADWLEAYYQESLAEMKTAIR